MNPYNKYLIEQYWVLCTHCFRMLYWVRKLAEYNILKQQVHKTYITVEDILWM